MRSLFVVVALVLAACGPTGSEAGKTATENPAAEPSAPATESASIDLDDIAVCDLVTSEEVAAAVGRPLVKGDAEVRSGVRRSRGCSWWAEANDDDVFLSMDVSVWPSGEELSGYLREGLGGAPIEVGDEAVWANNAMIAARKGAVQLGVRIGGTHGLEGDALKEKTLPLAVAAASRLP